MLYVTVIRNWSRWLLQRISLTTGRAIPRWHWLPTCLRGMKFALLEVVMVATRYWAKNAWHSELGPTLGITKAGLLNTCWWVSFTSVLTSYFISIFWWVTFTFVLMSDFHLDIFVSEFYLFVREKFLSRHPCKWFLRFC